MRRLPAKYLQQAAAAMAERDQTHRRALGARIAAARKERGWKQKQLAAAVHMEPLTISRWERGQHETDLDTLRRVADALGKPLRYFLDDAEPGPPVVGAPAFATPLDLLEAILPNVAAMRALGPDRLRSLAAQYRAAAEANLALADRLESAAAALL